MSSQEEFIYIHEIPLLIRRPLCDYLDSLKVWEKLAINHFQFNKSDLLGPRSCEIRGESPSNYLLQMWSNRGNHQIIELFQVFKNANLPKAMEIIKDVVDKKFHRFIKLNEENATKPKSTEIKHEQWKIHRILSKEDGEPELIKDINDLVDQMSVPRIPFEDLQICTNNWQSTLGKGGFGCVYSGEWKKTKVAIKQLNFSENPKGGMKSSVRMIVNEMKFMNSCHHSNVLQVFAYSIDQIPCLVFELMTGGSLRTRLKTKDPKKILSWRKRFEIAKESCRGIQYLHTFQGPRHLIHNDIKPENILLDRYDTPKIGDFGLAREGNGDNDMISKVFGTEPYLPDDFKLNRILTTKVDTYSFGVVMYEMVTNAKVYDKERTHKYLKDYVKAVISSGLIPKGFLDESIPMDQHVIEFLLRIGSMCVAKKSEHRPDMVQIQQIFDTFSLNNYHFENN